VFCWSGDALNLFSTLPLEYSEAVALVVYIAIGDPVVVSVAKAITSILVAIFKDETRDRIGLSR